MNIRRITILFALLSPTALGAQRAPGYDGTFPSERAQQALRDAAKTPWQDTLAVAGGGTWSLHAGGVTPHTLGPCRGDALELRTVDTKGPHLRLVRDHLAICLPSTTDGDVAATLRWLGRPVPDGVTGEPTANWKRAAARVAALGPETAGLRAALVADPERSGRLELVLWKVGTDPGPVTGTARLTMDGTPFPLRFVWPPKADPGAGRSHLQLAAGSTFVHTIDVEAMLREAGREQLAPGVWPLRVVLAITAPGGPDLELATPILELRVPEPNGGKAR